MDVKIENFETHRDDRGNLVVFLRTGDLPHESRVFGQIYFVSFGHEGVVRGNHYHKSWREWFGIVEGRLEVALYDVRTGESKRLVLDAQTDWYTRLFIGPYVAHAFRCVGSRAALLNYADKPWDETDTFPHELLT